MTVEEDAVRALLQTATPRLRGLDVGEVAGLAARLGARKRSGAARWAIAASVGAVLALAAGIGVAHRMAASPPASTSDYSKLVLRDGDTVILSGHIVALPQRPAQMCDPYAQSTSDRSATGDPQIDPCSTGIDVVGVDLSKLAARVTADGAVSGYANLTGTYRRGQIIVTRQAGYAFRSRPLFESTNFQQSPCPAPAGGWPKSRQPLLDEVAAYGRAHPGSIVTEAVLQPTPSSSIAYVLTSGDPAPVRRALTGTLSYGLCVVRSAYTRDQIAAASRAFTPETAPGVTATSSGGLSNDLQPQVTVWLRQITPELAATAGQQPKGLLKLSIWLTPAR